MNRSVVALEKHFGNTGCTAKIAVNLKRWMGIKKVRISSSTWSSIGLNSRRQLIHNQFIRMIPVQQPGP